MVSKGMMESGSFHDKKIGILTGGCSSEREISLRTGEAILGALQKKGYQACPIDVDVDLPARLREKKVEIAFIALHGKYGEDGSVQGMLEIMKIPYTGSGVLASALAMNKIVSKKIFLYHGLPVPDYQVLRKENWSDIQLLNDMGLPLMVKPASEGSSVGVTLVNRETELKEAIRIAFHYGEDIIVEKYIAGREIQTGILNDRVLGAIEVLPGEEFYDYEAKYTPGRSEYLLPAPLSREKYDEVTELGKKASSVLGCEGATRVDLIMDNNGCFHILEVNAQPGMTIASLLPKIALGVGLNFSDLVEEILKEASLKA